MHVESCCRAILADMLALVDRNKRGVCLDIGVGTFAFYCELFARLSYRTFAVEPVPTEALRSVCRWFGIRLVEGCVTDRDGMVELYLGNDGNGENLNMSSVMSDWWGSSERHLSVKSLTLQTLFRSQRIREVTCMKLDIEGAEFMVVSQMRSLPAESLPLIVQFEYGGGGVHASGQGGWAPRYMESTLLCLRVLADLGYRHLIIVESAPGSKERVLDLKPGLVSADQMFASDAIYGNVIATRQPMLEANRLGDLCRPYRDTTLLPPPEVRPEFSQLRMRWNALLCRLRS